MQSGGGNMNAAQLARLQQQLAQFGRGNGQQNMMNNMGGMGGQNQHLQQAFMQQQLQQNQGNHVGMVRRNSALGMNGNSAAALAMMQQQQQVGGSNMPNSNMSSYWNALQGQNTGGAMDASSASSAQLAALAGMNMNMNNNTSSQSNAASMLLGSRSSQPHNPGMGNPQMQAMGQTTDANLLQQQIAQLQRQLQQQQQNQNQGMGMQGISNMDRRNSGGNFNMQGSHQIFQQMQQMNGMIDPGMGMGSNSSMGNMLPTQTMQSHSMRGLNNSPGMISGASGGLSERDLLLQQQQLLRSSNMSSSIQNDASRVPDMFSNQDLMGQRRNTQGSIGGNFNNNMSAYDMDGSVSSQRSNVGNPLTGDNGDDGGNQKSFLDGSFAGGWQSNADLPDRRRIIFSILEVIRQMRPDTNKISQKLPHMAKSLEEHLYRSAQTKEEYLDPSTLKKRLQLIAHGLEIHRSSSSAPVGVGAPKVQSSSQQGNVPSEAEQLQQFLAMQQGGNNMNMSQNSMVMGGVQNNTPMDMFQGLGGGMDTSINGMDQSQSDNMNSNQDLVAAQKKKVIRQQQQRLLLLRHASKCKEGPSCKTKFCSQMMTLWKHMKKCRDKNCKTSHCLSSRCVLNHYRICKSQGRTSTCEVCGPVMEQIKRQDLEGPMDSSDPLAAKPDPDLPAQAIPQLQQPMSGFIGSGNQQNNMQAMQQQAMQQLFQQQQEALQNQQGGIQGMQNQNIQNQQGGILGMQNQNIQNQQGGMHGMQNQNIQNQQGGMQGLQNQNSLQALGGGGMQGMQNEMMNNSQNSGGQDLQQMQNLQSAQQKLQQQQQVLQQLQKQQNQLQEQQRQLQEQQAMLTDPGTQQAQQLQQQHQLLQQLQRRCQQQQALIQQDLMLQMKTLEQGSQDMHIAQHQLIQTMDHSQRSQQMGNSQNSHHSQSSNHLQGNRHMGGMSHNQSNDLMTQMQNSLQNESSADEHDLLQMQQVLKSQHSSSPGEESLERLKDEKEPQPYQELVLEEGGHDPKDKPRLGSHLAPQGVSEPVDDTGRTDEASKEQEPSESNDRPRTVGGRGKGARGRGGKGKRLRDIADDLGSAGAPLSATDATSISERKRDLEALGGDDERPTKQLRSDGQMLESEKNGEGETSSSLTSSMPKGDVEQHLLLLHKGLHLTSRTITHKCLPIVQQLIDDPFGWVFRDAVDPVVFGLPDYFEVVKNPMHLLLVKKKLENAVYTDMASFERDVKLVFENAILYNGEESEVGQLAQTMMGVFEREYKKVCEEIRSDIPPIGPNDCTLCGLNRRKFQPPVLYCVGMTCGMERIKRNATYYTTGSNQNIWCEKCFAKFKESESITLDDGTETSSSRLHQAKNDANPEETWVRCDGCHANVHQICALTGDRIRNPDEKWFCPKCDLRNREDSFLPPSKFERRADDLQRCDMSDFMEEGLRKILEKAYELKSKEMQIPLEEIEKAHGLAIRVLSHITKKHAVRDEMFELYSKVGCPSYFPAHTKCIGLFQKIDGIDVLLFVMYVYEYGHDCPAPNRRRVYISYLDSVQYFQPSTFRTLAYQSVIIQYLRFVKKRGFHTAHIWSCPPTPGDEYVFYCHPVSQRIPQEDKLRGWYVDLLEKAKDEGIVVETTNFYEEYFADSNAPCVSAVSPMSLPYFEGDYIPGEIENILSHLSKEEKRNLPVAKAIPRRSGSKLGTRSNPGNLVSHTQDKIMERLGKAIYNIKENLMIARLRTKAFVTAIERDDDVARWPDNDDQLLPLIKGTDSCVSTNKQIDILSDGEYENFNADVDDANRPVTRKEISRAFANTSGPMVGTSEDKDPQFESELFENRQLFLNYCQMNNCQFDDLRKAKHTTMMVLYQLHTPAAPKFFQQCGSCQRDIVHGNRYHCNICSSFDLCDACYKVVSTGARSSGGQANRHDASHSFTKISLRDYAEARRSAEERQKSLQGYLGVLVHAANCLGPPGCKLNNCEKMKKLFVHVRTCDLTYIKGCKVCHRLVSLIIVHARSCDVRGSCSLPFCDKIRERNERVRRQQQLMDDRRREAQNSYYNAGDGP